MRTPKPSGKPGKTHERKAGTYDRHAGHRPIGKRILIVCEGAKTEPNYFKALRRELKLTLVEVEIEENAGAPDAIVATAKRISDKRKGDERFDEIWCVFDREGDHNNATFPNAVQKADFLKYKLGISNPAFEFWYIPHFECTDRVFRNGEEVKAYLKKHIPEYKESMHVFNSLREKTALAIRHSKQVLENHPSSEERFPNPSTFVHELVEELIQMSPSGRAHFFK